MKYKLFLALICLLAVVLSLAVPAVEEGRTPRYHQHIDASEKVEDRPGSGEFSTHLPLVKIETGGVEIPGKAIVDKHRKILGHTTAANGAETITAHMDIVDHESTYNHAGDEPTMSSEIDIHVRGNSSRAFDKSSYSIRLIDEKGERHPLPLLGMDAHHEWALYGPYLDKTLMRNYMWYNIGGEIMDYAPNVRFCEVILNGEYQGVYVLVEKVSAGKNGARLDLTADAKKNSFNGYLLQLNGNRAPASGNSADQFTFYAKRSHYQLDIEFPGRNSLTPEMKNAISKDFSNFEKALYSYDYDNVKFGYPAYIDIESFIDYFLINEVTCNYDAGWLSTFIYKDMSGKFRMCLWDMNSVCDNYQEQVVNITDFQMQHCLWYVMLFKDEDFVDAVVDRYWKLRQTYLSLDYLNQYIDDTVAYLGPAIQRNYEKWGYTFQEAEDLLTPTERNPRNYEQAIQQMKDFLVQRAQWMDDNIDVLRQYSAESKVKKFNENAN